jgi:hypothetical protein
MALLDPAERDELVDLIAQAVIDRIDERERVARLADLVVDRVLALQQEEAELIARDLVHAKK